MSEMANRIVRVLDELIPDEPITEDFKKVAHAILVAMREPTSEMLRVMEPWTRTSGHQDLVWRAGIDEALK